MEFVSLFFNVLIFAKTTSKYRFQVAEKIVSEAKLRTEQTSNEIQVKSCKTEEHVNS